MSKASSAEWFNRSWSPINGRCPHNCVDLEGQPYCYMWRPGGIGDRFKKTHDHPLCLNEKILNHPPKSGRVLVGSSTDMWVDEVPDEWIGKIFENLSWFQCRRNVLFFFLTKKPRRYNKIAESPIRLPTRVWYGTTWDGMHQTNCNVIELKILHKNPLHGIRADGYFQPKKFVSFEPLLADPSHLGLEGIQWIIIGADSRKGKPKPPKEWAEYLIAEARRVGAMVFVKENYEYPERIKEMPCLS